MTFLEAQGPFPITPSTEGREWHQWPDLPQLGVWALLLPTCWCWTSKGPFFLSGPLSPRLWKWSSWAQAPRTPLSGSGFLQGQWAHTPELHASQSDSDSFGHGLVAGVQLCGWGITLPPTSTFGPSRRSSLEPLGAQPCRFLSALSAPAGTGARTRPIPVAPGQALPLGPPCSPGTGRHPRGRA